MPSTRLPDKEKITRYLDAVSARAGELHPKLATCMTIVQPFIVLPIQLMSCCAPFYLWACKWAYVVYTWLPKQAAIMLFGFALCFFGGTCAP